MPVSVLQLCALLLPLAASSALAQAQDPSTTQPVDQAEASSLVTCTTELRLSGSVYDAEHPERSMAVFEVPSSHLSAVYRLGSWVGSWYELVAVVPRGVVLRNSEGECWLRLVGGSNDSDQRHVAVKAKPQAKSKKAKSKKTNNNKAGGAVVIGAAR